MSEQDPLTANPLELVAQPHVRGGIFPRPMVEPPQTLGVGPVSSSWPVDVYGVPLPRSEPDVPYPVPSSPSVNLAGAHVSHSNTPKCSCLLCLGIGATYYSDGKWLSDAGTYVRLCQVPGCSYTFHSDPKHMFPRNSSWMRAHERSHYGNKGHYRCAEEGCRATLKRWHDFTRHYTVHHCKVAKRYPCSVSDCKYAGENGFLRLDKLKSHYRNKHQKAKANLPKAALAGPRPGNHGEKKGGEPFSESSFQGAYGAQM